MRTFTSLTNLNKVSSTVVTLGNFDGIHLGHQKLLKKVKDRSRILKIPSVVYTFHPHPRQVLSPDNFLPLIVDKDTKEVLIASLGIDYLIHAKFSKDYALMTPYDFAKNIIKDGLKASEVWVGENYNFGKNKSGTIDLLKTLGTELGFKVFTVSGKSIGGKIVSSTRLRDEILDGNLSEVKKLTNRHLSITGLVVKGKNLGKSLGFPTANIAPFTPTLPKNGVYSAFIKIKRTLYPAVVNIGTTPTIGVKNNTMEVHILDFNRKIYGENVTTYFIKRLRDERKFGSKEELILNINNDINTASKHHTKKIKDEI